MKKFTLLLVSLFMCVAILNACTKREAENPNYKVLQFPLGDDVKTLDPSNAYDTVSLTVMPLAMESLFQYSYLKTPLELEPLLAESMPQVSKDKKIYTIKIKKGVLFHNDSAFPNGKGRELKAQDFIYAWKRMLVPSLQSNGTWIFEDKVLGYTELKKQIMNDKSKTVDQHLATEIEGMKALDDYTIQIKLTQAYPQLLHVLAMGFGAPVAKEVTDKYGQEGLNERMVGTGPFMLKQATRGSKIILIKNPNFREEKYPSDGDAAAKTSGLLTDAGKKLPFIDEIIFSIFKEDQPSWLNFQKGRLDASGIPKDNFSTAVLAGNLSPDLAKKEIQLRKGEEPVIWYLNFNMKDKILGSNTNLRKAIVRAIDRDYMINLFLNGRGIKATSIIPREIAGHTDRKELIGDYNLEEAKKYLVKAGYPEGKGLPPIRYDLRGSSTTARQQAEYMSKALAQIGVTLQVEVNTFPAYLEKEKNGNLQFFTGGWSADYPDPENFLQLLYGKNVSPGPNASNWSNPAFDKLYEKIAAMTPSKERTALIYKAEQIVFDEAVWSMMYYPIRYSLYQAWLKNYRPNALILNDIKYLDIDLAKKKDLKSKF